MFQNRNLFAGTFGQHSLDKCSRRYKLLYAMLDCFNPNLDQIWTNPNVGLKM